MAATFDSFETFEQHAVERRPPPGRPAASPPADTVDADWAVDRQAYVDVPSGDGDGDRAVNRSSLRISGADCGPRSGAKHLGADNRAVLAAVLGLSRADVDDLLRSGVIVERPPA